MFGGQVGIAGHAVIGDRVLSGAQAGIAGSIRKGHVTVQGSPAIDAKISCVRAWCSNICPKCSRNFTACVKKLKNLRRISNQKVGAGLYRNGNCV